MERITVVTIYSTGAYMYMYNLSWQTTVIATEEYVVCQNRWTFPQPRMNVYCRVFQGGLQLIFRASGPARQVLLMLEYTTSTCATNYMYCMNAIQSLNLLSCILVFSRSSLEQ